MAGIFDMLRRDGRRVVARLFKSEKEIRDFIQTQEPGDYLVYRIVSAGDQEEWGMVTRRQDGSVERQPFPSEDE